MSKRLQNGVKIWEDQVIVGMSLKVWVKFWVLRHPRNMKFFQTVLLILRWPTKRKIVLGWRSFILTKCVRLLGKKNTVISLRYFVISDADLDIPDTLPDSFHCDSDNKEIPWYQTCNNYPDCPDGSDEFICGPRDRR